MRRPLVATGAGLALALAAVLAVAQAASAHDRLIDATPADGATTSSVDVVTLTYSAALLGPSDETANLAQVLGPDGRHYEIACASVADAVMTVPVALGVPGEYTVSWRVVSSDGHPVSGDYAFAYAPEDGAQAAAGAATSPCAAVASGGQDASAASDDMATGAVIGLSAGAAAVVGILVIIVTIAAKGREDKPRD